MANTGKAGSRKSGKDKEKGPPRPDPRQVRKFVWEAGDVTVLPPPSKKGGKPGKAGEK